MYINFRVLFWLLLASVLTNCTQNGVTTQELPSFIRINPSLIGELELITIDKRTNSDNLIVFEAEFENISNEPKHIIYKVMWEDQDGITFKTIFSKYQYSEVQPNDFLIIRGTSPDKRATNFFIYIQEDK